MVSQFHKGLYYAMRHRIGDSTLAEDICQETWRILLEKFRQHGTAALQDAMLLPAYIHNTAFNVFLAEQRRNQRRQTEADSDLLLDVADEGSGDFVDQLAASRIQKRVREVIDGMNNARDKLVLYRYYIQEQSKEQICRELGLDHRHFDRVAHRARERLRKAVEDTAADLHQEVGSRVMSGTTGKPVGISVVGMSVVGKQDAAKQDVQQETKQVVSKGH
ncbi:MAG: sigma-70 family RNA polymerase sigma factor [Pseudomonadota bacterium]